METNKTQVLDVLEAIQTNATAHAAERADRDVPEIDFIRTMQVGEFTRQGDIYIELVNLDVAGLKVTAERQLAPGNTQGSRHIMAGNCTVYERKQGVLVGPAVVCSERVTVTHPEHNHKSLPSTPEGTAYAITFQRDWAQEEAARVAD